MTEHVYILFKQKKALRTSVRGYLDSVKIFCSYDLYLENVNRGTSVRAYMGYDKIFQDLEPKLFSLF